jgi:hypothetical protein
MRASVMDKALDMQFEDYDPSYVIQAVNFLQPLGKEKALEQIESCIKSRPGHGDNLGLFWILRVLFDMPNGMDFLPVRLGSPSIPPPPDPGKIPRFPIMMIREIPLLIVSGYFLGGLPETVDVHVAYFRTHGIIRHKPLLPPQTMSGLENEFLEKWRDAYEDRYLPEVLETIRVQFERLEGAMR